MSPRPEQVEWMVSLVRTVERDYLGICRAVAWRVFTISEKYDRSRLDLCLLISREILRQKRYMSMMLNLTFASSPPTWEQVITIDPIERWSYPVFQFFLMNIHLHSCLTGISQSIGSPRAQIKYTLIGAPGPIYIIFSAST